LLELVAEGLQPQAVVEGGAGEREHLARLVPPEVFRMYSISSLPGEGAADELH